MELVIYVLILSFIGVFLFFLWIGNIQDRDDNVIQVDESEITRMDEPQPKTKNWVDISLISNPEKRILYEKLIQSGATEAEAYRFVSG